MIGDNPAARLLAILELGIQQDQNIKCRDIWRKLLNVEGGDDALLMSRLGKVMELPQQAIQIIKKTCQIRKVHTVIGMHMSIKHFLSKI